MTGPTVAIRCDKVEFRYGPDSPPMRFDGAFAPGEITALVGPSGSGKSTLLNLLAGFETPDAGRILFDDIDMTAAPVSQRPVSMVFQENNLFAHMTVFNNVALGISPSLRLSGQQAEAVEIALASVGLAGFGGRRPAQLSGGERQRVALARVIVREKPVLLLDEPFASLGPALRRGMLDLLAKIQFERRMTTVMVTHFPDDARRAASQAMFLAEGEIAACGPVSTVLDPQTAPPPVRRYLGATVSEAPAR